MQEVAQKVVNRVQCYVTTNDDMPTYKASDMEQLFIIENLYSPSKHGRTVNNTNQIKKQLQRGQKYLKLNSNFDTRLVHNTLGKAKSKYRVGQKTGLFLEVCNSRIC